MLHLKPLDTKKISRSLIPLLVMAVFLLIVPHPAHAFLGFDLGNTVGTAIGSLWSLLFYILQVILIFLLFVTTFLLDNVLKYNVILNPNNMDAVKAGWTILKDIANSLFLIILLWIAIKIIWSFDEGGAKKLLVRLIIVAFLINFSLVITGAIFGFANALAMPFSQAMGDDVGGFIIANTKLNTVQQTDSESGAAALAAAFDADIKNCGFSTLLDPSTQQALGQGCSNGNNAKAIMLSLAKPLAGLANNVSMKEAMELGISDIFLILVIITFCGVIGMLILRIAMMVFLGVISPAAFFLYALPGGESLYQRWQRNVIGWAFTAPCFYFLFYLSLLVLKAMTSTQILKQSGGVSLAANIFAFLPLIVFLVFMWTSLNICKKLGGEVAGTAIDIGKKVGGLALAAGAAAATGGTSLALAAGAKGALGAAGGLAEGGALMRVASRPILGKLIKPATNFMHARNEKINDMRESYSKLPKQERARLLQTTWNGDKRLALAESMHENGEFRKLPQKTRDQLTDLSKPLGRMDLYKANIDRVKKADVPDTVSDYDAKKKIWNSMTPAQKSNTSKLEDNETKKAFFETATKKDMEEILKSNAEMMQNLVYGFFNENNVFVQSYFHQNEAMLRTIMKPELLNFLGTMRIQAAMGAARQQPNNQNPNPAAPPTPPGNNP